MSRIEPIAASRALVRFVRDGGRPDARRPAERAGVERRRRQGSASMRSGAADAAAAAAFEVHRLSNGAARGLKADLGVRRQWTSVYQAAARGQAGATRPSECARA